MEAEIRYLRRSAVLSVVWLVIIAVSLTSSTFAWFTNSMYTNVTPMSGTVSQGDGELLISNRKNGVFAETADLILNSTAKALYPVSTGDLTWFYRASYQDSSGIIQRYEDATPKVDSSTLHGVIYLKSQGGACDVYFNRAGLSFGKDNQALAALRLGLRIQSTAGSQTMIFSLDDMGQTKNADSRLTVPQDRTVVAAIRDDGTPQYTADPSVGIGGYCAGGSDTQPTAGEKRLCTLRADEIASVEYWVYLEGCDSNCINAVQARELSLQLGFAGVPVGGNG